MNTYSTFAMPRARLLGIAAVVLTLCGASATAAVSSGTTAEIQARYEQERAKCLNGTSNQDRTTCLKEAGAARDTALRGQLDGSDAQYRRNATERCKALPGDEAKDCLARMKGEGTTRGSVEAGGIYRETVTREVAPIAAPVPASGASAP